MLLIAMLQRDTRATVMIYVAIQRLYKYYIDILSDGAAFARERYIYYIMTASKTYAITAEERYAYKDTAMLYDAMPPHAI